MEFSKVKSGFLLIFLIGILTSCSVKYLPVPTKNITISEGYAIQKQEDYVFAVSNKYWIREPQNLTDYFTTFHISVKNKSSEKIEVAAADISLLDASGTQFDAVGTDYVLELLVPEEIAYDHYLEVPEEHRQIWENWREAKKYLIRLYTDFPKAKNRFDIIFNLAGLYAQEGQFLLSWYLLNELFEESSEVQKFIIYSEINRIKEKLVQDSLTVNQFKNFKPVFEEHIQKEPQ